MVLDFFLIIISRVLKFGDGKTGIAIRLQKLQNRGDPFKIFGADYDNWKQCWPIRSPIPITELNNSIVY